MQLAKISFEEKTQILRNLKIQIEGFQDQKIEQDKSSGVIIAKVERLKVDLLKKEQVLTSRQKTFNAFVNGLRQQESDKKIKNERIIYLKEKQDAYKESLESDNLRVEEIELQVNKLLKSHEGNKVILTDLEVRVSSLQEDYDLQKVSNNKFQVTFNESNFDFKEQHEKVNKSKNSIEVNTIRLKTLEDEMKKNLSTSESRNLEIESTEASLKLLVKELKERNDVIDNLEKKEVYYQS